MPTCAAPASSLPWPAPAAPPPPPPRGGPRLTRAKLGDADLGADPGNQPMGIMRTDASSADFTGADLHGANLRKVNFTRADLSGADLTMADVAGADFSAAILRSIRGRSQMR